MRKFLFMLATAISLSACNPYEPREINHKILERRIEVYVQGDRERLREHISMSIAPESKNSKEAEFFIQKDTLELLTNHGFSVSKQDPVDSVYVFVERFDSGLTNGVLDFHFRYFRLLSAPDVPNDSDKITVRVKSFYENELRSDTTQEFLPMVAGPNIHHETSEYTMQMIL